MKPLEPIGKYRSVLPARREVAKKRRIHTVCEHFAPVHNSPKYLKTDEECCLQPSPSGALRFFLIWVLPIRQLNIPIVVIPSNVGIQEHTGCRIKPGMTLLVSFFAGIIIGVTTSSNGNNMIVIGSCSVDLPDHHQWYSSIAAVQRLSFSRPLLFFVIRILG
jgi:hypothetical protein